MIPGVIKERDPNLISLEKNIFSSLKEISEEDDREKNILSTATQNICQITTLSPEEAIKELLLMHRQNKM
jgi:hypothetical protein